MSPLDGKWRRLEEALTRVRDGLSSPDPAGADALVSAMSATYSLWEVWTTWRGLRRIRDEDQQVAGDVGGETTAAIVYARGGEVHDVVEFGEYLGYGNMPFGRGPYGGACWFWQPYHDPDPRFAQRSHWYGSHVERRMVTEPLDVVHDWLRNQPELR